MTPQRASDNKIGHMTVFILFRFILIFISVLIRISFELFSGLKGWNKVHFDIFHVCPDTFRLFGKRLFSTCSFTSSETLNVKVTFDDLRLEDIGGNFNEINVVPWWFSPVILQISLRRDVCGCVTKCVMQMRVITENNWIFQVNSFEISFRLQTPSVYTPKSGVVCRRIRNVDTPVDSPLSALQFVFLLRNDRTTSWPANWR